MDPNAALEQIRQVIRANAGRDGGASMTESEAVCLFDHVEALDGWMSKGGFLPDAWAKGRT